MPGEHTRASARAVGNKYRGRIAPSPTGYLHLGHLSTFRIAAERAAAAKGTLTYRDEDLDRARCTPAFAEAALTDLRRSGLRWTEGPDVGGPHALYRQSERFAIYRAMWQRLCRTGWIYPCEYSRRQVAAHQQQNQSRQTDGDVASTPKLSAAEAAQSSAAFAGVIRESREALFPTELRPEHARSNRDNFRAVNRERYQHLREPGARNWRLRVPDGETLRFRDGNLGPGRLTAGQDFGDFLIWRKDGAPSYEFAVVVDDVLMGITEVVRGADLLLSTGRQLLVYQAMGWSPPEFYHCELLRDESGQRLAKRHDSLAIRELLDRGDADSDIEALIARHLR